MSRPRNARISVAELHELLTLDLSTGQLYWKARSSDWFLTKQAAGNFIRRVGNRADLAVYPLNGYARVRLVHPRTRQKFDISAHRIVFALAHGRWPELEVDHIDGCRTNNRPDNLRELSHRDNLRAAVQRRAARRQTDAGAC